MQLKRRQKQHQEQQQEQQRRRRQRQDQLRQEEASPDRDKKSFDDSATTISDITTSPRAGHGRATSAQREAASHDDDDDDDEDDNDSISRYDQFYVAAPPPQFLSAAQEKMYQKQQEQMMKEKTKGKERQQKQKQRKNHSQKQRQKQKLKQQQQQQQMQVQAQQAVLMGQHEDRDKPGRKAAFAPLTFSPSGTHSLEGALQQLLACHPKIPQDCLMQRELQMVGLSDLLNDLLDNDPKADVNDLLHIYHEDGLQLKKNPTGKANASSSHNVRSFYFGNHGQIMVGEVKKLERLGGVCGVDDSDDRQSPTLAAAPAKKLGSVEKAPSTSKLLQPGWASSAPYSKPTNFKLTSDDADTPGIIHKNDGKTERDSSEVYAYADQGSPAQKFPQISGAPNLPYNSNYGSVGAYPQMLQLPNQANQYHFAMSQQQQMQMWQMQQMHMFQLMQQNLRLGAASQQANAPQQSVRPPNNQTNFEQHADEAVSNRRKATNNRRRGGGADDNSLGSMSEAEASAHAPGETMSVTSEEQKLMKSLRRLDDELVSHHGSSQVDRSSPVRKSGGQRSASTYATAQSGQARERRFANKRAAGKPRYNVSPRRHSPKYAGRKAH